MVDSSLELQESGWEELRKEARKIEGDLDVKLSSYAKLAARFTHSSGFVENGSSSVGPNRSWKSMEIEIESLLEKLLDINDAMSRCAASAASTTSVTQKLARHRDILHEYSQEFRRTKLNLSSLKEHAELLNSVREDITESKASGSMSPRVHLLRERASIHGSINQIDEVISQAHATRSVLGTQRAFFGDVQGKVKQLGDKFPTIYGPVMSLKLGEISTVVVSSAEAAREIMKTHDIVFATRPINYTSKNLFYGGNTIAFSPYGEYWRQMRRICNMELLSAKRVCSFRAVREEELCRLIRSISASSGTTVNFSKEMAEISSNIMARAAIGGKCGDKKMFYSTLSGVVELSTGLNIVDLFPSFPFIGHITGYQRRLERCQKELDLMAENNIREHAEKMIKRSTSEDDDELLMEDDFTDVLLRIQRQGSLPFPLTKERVKAVVNDMLFGGSETTSTLMEWMMSELIQNPNIMKKVQSEVREAFGSSGMSGKLAEEEATSGRLKYLQLVIKETLRLHPPAPLLLPRENQERCEVMGYDIPAKTTVIVNMWAIARDARHWAHPDIFWPERFEESSLDFKGNHLEFMPFGAGRRICPGMQFALAMVETVMSHLLYYFDWEYLGKKLDMGEAVGLTTRREFPLCIVPTVRYPLQPSA